MIVPSVLPETQCASVLGRANPLTKLAIAVIWLIGLAFTTRYGPPIAIATVAIAAGLLLGGIPVRTFLKALGPLWVVALVVTAGNAAFGAANPDPLAHEILRIGPLRLTEEAMATAIGLGLRVVAIASVGAVFALTTDSTRLVDALVQQGRAPERFAYGALAAYQAVPKFAQDLVTLRQARRIRGLGGTWHPGLVFALLVLAIRHGDRMAVAMDARGFGSRPRSHYRPLRWSLIDGLFATAGAAVLAVALTQA
jgi:energy-coupling factor transport system permease protein